MATDLKKILESVAASLSAAVDPQGAGQIIAASVNPTPGNVELHEILTGPLNFTSLTKNVTFADANPEPDPLDLDGKVTAVTSATSGVISQFTGTVPLLNKISVPVSMKVEWEVTYDDGSPILPKDYAVLDGRHIRPGLVGGTNILVAFAPQLYEMSRTKPAPEPKVRYLVPKVTLTARNPLSNEPITEVKPELPAISVPVPAIGIPRLLAAFRHFDFAPREEPNHDGFVLLFVPSSSPLHSLDHLKDTLATAQEAFAALKSIPAFGSILPGLNTLVEAVTASPYFVFVAHTQIPNLNDLTAIQRRWFRNDTEVDNGIGSMILMGGDPNAKLDVYNATGFLPGDGHMTVSVPEYVTVIHNLRKKHPRSHPPQAVDVQTVPEREEGFDDGISSLRWTSL